MRNTKENFKSKLEVNNLFIKAPMNLKCLLSNTERDFLEAVIHLQTLGRYNTSDSLIMANSGLNSRQITEAKRNLIKLDLISVASDKSPLGSRYKINEQTYNELLRQLNSIRSATERFEAGDAYRTSKEVKPIFNNIINTLRRRLSIIDVPTEERITTAEPQQHTKEYAREHLKEIFEKGLITNEEYHNKLKRLK